MQAVAGLSEAGRRTGRAILVGLRRSNKRRGVVLGIGDVALLELPGLADPGYKRH